MNHVDLALFHEHNTAHYVMFTLWELNELRYEMSHLKDQKTK